MGSTDPETSKSKYQYETVKGLFMQDDPKTDWKDFDYVRSLLHLTSVQRDDSDDRDSLDQT